MKVQSRSSSIIINLKMSTQAQKVLSSFKSKRSLNKSDLYRILKLPVQDQRLVVSHISHTRQKLLMKHLEDVPALDEHFDFPLSRRESTVVSDTNSGHTPGGGAGELPPSSDKRPKLTDWMGDLKKTHEKFTFTPASELQIKPNNTHLEGEECSVVPQLFSEENTDPIKQVIKRIMYAEGDHLGLWEECAVYLKDALQVLSRHFMLDIKGEPEEAKKHPAKRVLRVVQHNEERLKSHKLDMGLLQYVFSESVERFYAHKQLSKFYRDTEDGENIEALAEEQEIEQEEETSGGLKLPGLEKTRSMAEVLQELKEENRYDWHWQKKRKAQLINALRFDFRRGLSLCKLALSPGPSLLDMPHRQRIPSIFGGNMLIKILHVLENIRDTYRDRTSGIEFEEQALISSVQGCSQNSEDDEDSFEQLDQEEDQTEFKQEIVLIKPDAAVVETPTQTEHSYY